MNRDCECDLSFSHALVLLMILVSAVIFFEMDVLTIHIGTFLLGCGASFAGVELVHFAVHMRVFPEQYLELDLSDLHAWADRIGLYGERPDGRGWAEMAEKIQGGW